MAASWFAAPHNVAQRSKPAKLVAACFFSSSARFAHSAYRCAEHPAPPFTTLPTPLATISACGAMLMANAPALRPYLCHLFAVLVQVVKPLLSLLSLAPAVCNVCKRARQRLQLRQIVADSVHHINGKQAELLLHRQKTVRQYPASALFSALLVIMLAFSLVPALMMNSRSIDHMRLPCSVPASVLSSNGKLFTIFAPPLNGPLSKQGAQCCNFLVRHFVDCAKYTRSVETPCPRVVSDFATPSAVKPSSSSISFCFFVAFSPLLRFV